MLVARNGSGANESIEVATLYLEAAIGALFEARTTIAREGRSSRRIADLSRSVVESYEGLCRGIGKEIKSERSIFVYEA